MLYQEIKTRIEKWLDESTFPTPHVYGKHKKTNSLQLAAFKYMKEIESTPINRRAKSAVCRAAKYHLIEIINIIDQ